MRSYINHMLDRRCKRGGGCCTRSSTLPMIAAASGKSVRSFHCHCICVSAASIASCVESRIRRDGSEYSQDSINHPYARYGSRYSQPGSHNLRGLSCDLALRISTSDNSSATRRAKRFSGKYLPVLLPVLPLDINNYPILIALALLLHALSQARLEG
jgi:hypothetical protein